MVLWVGGWEDLEDGRVRWPCGWKGEMILYVDGWKGLVNGWVRASH